jgi:hypothetical protein
VAFAGAGTLAPKATAAAFSPMVIDSIKSAAKSFGSDESDQEKIEKALMATLGLAGTAAAMRTPKTAATPASRPAAASAIAEEAVSAASELEKALGIPAPLTAAEATGSVGTAKRESFVRRIGAGDGSRPLAYEIQQTAIGDALKKVVSEGAEQAGPKSAVGAQVAREITAGEEALRGRTAETAGAAAQDIAGTVNKAVGPVEEASALGQRVRESGQFTIEANKAANDAQFANAESLRLSKGGPSDFIVPKEVQKTASKLRALLPSQAGAPIEGLATGQKLLLQLEGWTDPQTLGQFNQAISTVGEALGRKSAGIEDTFGSGFTKGNLKQLYKALITDRDNAFNSLAPDVKPAYDQARSFFKQNIQDIHENPIVAKVLNDAGDGGLSNTGEIASYFASNEGKLADLMAIKKLVAPADYDSLKSGILNSLRSKSTIPTASGGVEDLTVLGKAFRELAPEFKRELMGSDAAAKELQLALDDFGLAKKATETLGQRNVASPEAMQALIDGIRSGDGKLARKQLGEAIAQDAARSRDYFNGITKDIRSGNLGKVPVDPARFVDDFLLKADDVNTVRAALQQLSGETRENVRLLTAQKFFELAADQDNSTVSQLLKGEGEISGQKLIDLFVKEPKRREVLQALIPEQSKELITNYIKYQRGILNARKLGGSSGLVAGQAQFGGSGRGGNILGIIPQIGESVLKLRVNRFVAKAFFSKPVQEIMKRAAGGDFLAVAVAASATAKAKSAIPGSVKSAASSIPTLTRDDLMALSAQFGVAKVRQYLEAKRDIDQKMAQMDDDGVTAMTIIAPELALPIQVEGDESK